MDCPNCGATIRPGINRCEKCGSYVEQVTAPPAQPMQQPVVQQPYVQPSQVSAPKSRVVAGVLGILLGGLGVHRFYMDSAGIGVAQLLLTLLGGPLTCGVTALGAWIWGLTEGILILVGAINTDGNGQPFV